MCGPDWSNICTEYTPQWTRSALPIRPIDPLILFQLPRFQLTRRQNRQILKHASDFSQSYHPTLGRYVRPSERVDILLRRGLPGSILTQRMAVFGAPQLGLPPPRGTQRSSTLKKQIFSKE
ncbi:hypothetical protein AG1IA_02764 [Rhizoctonia solani AG-1 IA]|uniref:Uncharacterized protein n=1 Tax=Thanatephorus cucumeris (strain AG1-IA) TaxID=983506 RepID=L8X296_THACA|nr:hypothetical protein AG1IA_02764 [Rhizoctonia solani AG-1 IA]